jgi:hypothetical protein
MCMIVCVCVIACEWGGVWVCAHTCTYAYVGVEGVGGGQGSSMSMQGASGRQRARRE